MAKQMVEALVEGGKATAAPPLGPALGPLGVNIGQVVSEINKKTEDFKGMQVPVKVVVNTDDKSFSITIGTPPASALIKKEANIEKGSGSPLMDKVADLRIEQIIKIAKMKQDALMGRDLFARVKEVIGTCDSMGILVEGKQARETIADINKGMHAEEIKAEKTELSAEELKALEEEKKRLEEETKKRREEFLAKGKTILAEMAGKAKG
ncbi:50S ribosomal protein L11 [Candidatus Woesearchaeota archaeon]|nr:50S ribosomal protein L11 [Candidatus Woesearchaeota archaeon]